jgi:divalent metal cation (Fe/Co/Zn/Cd) transporter
METQKSGERTLLASILLSSPGPLVLGTALFFGRSSTQIADFVRRTSELAAIFVSWIVFRRIRKEEEISFEHKEKLEKIANLSVGIAMCLSGTAMTLIALLSENTEKGNVIPALVIALLGVITNSWFWIRYTNLGRSLKDNVLTVQSKLYRAKTFVDLCVTAALFVVVIKPSSSVAKITDLAGSLIVSLYLFVTGIAVIAGKSSVVKNQITKE